MRKYAAQDRMIAIAGGKFWMGSDDHYLEERPSHSREVGPFEIDETPVTNAHFVQFVEATGYVTLAERALDPQKYPHADPALLQPGSSVFVPPLMPPLSLNPMLWWRYDIGANWRTPQGVGSHFANQLNHPVVHVAYEDAEAYASWANKRLPSEAEWEFAARGGLERSAFAWGDELAPDGLILANYWHGNFPSENIAPDGWSRTSPVGTYPPNDFGIYDMIGNVWEWTSDWYKSSHEGSPGCCSAQARAGSHDPHDPGHNFPRKVLKGGSHLCAENYCRRYRPAARYPQTIDTSTSHIGFRCARDKQP